MRGVKVSLRIVAKAMARPELGAIPAPSQGTLPRNPAGSANRVTAD